MLPATHSNLMCNLATYSPNESPTVVCPCTQYILLISVKLLNTLFLRASVEYPAEDRQYEEHDCGGYVLNMGNILMRLHFM